ncbi:MAG: hypothetical protein WD929_06310 [Steroidobacteraceae bacterium]
MTNSKFGRVLPTALLFLVTACGGGGGSGPPVAGPPSPPPPPPPPPTVQQIISLRSDAGDFIGAGQEYEYSNADALIAVTAVGARLSIAIHGDESWSASFQLPETYSELQPGSYPNLTRFGFHDPAVGGMDWSGEGRGCNTLTGWLIIDSVTYDGATLESIDLRFEQHCGGDAAALHGEIEWDVNDPTSPPGPVVPPPAGLWEPAPGVTPATGNYVYLESQPGDFVGFGGVYGYTEANAVLTVNAAQNRLSVSVMGDEQWNGDFQGMHMLSRLEVGYYGDLQRFPFHNPVKGGLDWFGEGRGCNSLSGWVVVDRVTYSGETLTAIDLRFAQHCERGVPALHGEIHWDVNDTTNPPGPVVPPPPGLWEPPPGETPATGNFVYLESQPGDFIGNGGSYLYTPADAQFTAEPDGALLNIDINGDENWSGRFLGMNTLSRLEVGYYGDLQRFPFNNPVKGGLMWFGEGRGCNTLTGWFVIDSVTYEGATLVAIDLRFEQHCEGSAPALHGAIRWDIDDPTSPPGPVVPPPPGLWEPAPGATPAAGNYVYLESQPGDFIGQGRTYLYTLADSLITTFVNGARLNIGVLGDEDWAAEFQGMNILSRLEPGYYGDLQRAGSHNPVKGGLSWGGEGRGCNTLTGWFVVDSVTYVGTTLTAIDLRFEQHCEGGAPALRGEIHWEANDNTTPPGPVVPPPPGLWEPPPGATPATGNYVYLESEPGDFIGQGRTYLHTPADSLITMTSTDARLSIFIDGDPNWGGNFQGMNTLARLEAGYYGDLQRIGFHNPTKGGFDWGAAGRGCNILTAWVVIDSVTYVGMTLTAIELRFEQHCEGLPPALRGKIRWSQ